MANLDIILGVDPGLTTGISIFDIEKQTFEVGLQLRKHEACDRIEELLCATEGRDVLAAVEKFVINAATAKKSPQDHSLKVNGVVEWRCCKHDHLYEEQMAVSAKKIAADARLKDMGLFVPGRDHANDATRHVILALERKMPRLLDDDSLFGYNGRIEIIDVGRT